MSSFDPLVQNSDAVFEGPRLLRRSVELHNHQGFRSDDELIEQLDRTLAESVWGAVASADFISSRMKLGLFLRSRIVKDRSFLGENEFYLEFF